MARQLRPDTRLARLILDAGKPAYVVAGEVGINYNRLLDYADGRIDMSHPHRIKLARYFGIDPPHGLGTSSNEDDVDAFDGARFDALVKGARVVPGGDAIVTLLVEQWGGHVDEAWKLTGATGLVLDVRVCDEFDTRGCCEFSASVDDVRVKPGVGVEVRLPRARARARHSVGVGVIGDAEGVCVPALRSSESSTGCVESVNGERA